MRKFISLFLPALLFLTADGFSQHYVTNEFSNYFRKNQISEAVIFNHYYFKFNKQGKIYEIQDSLYNSKKKVYKFDSLGRISSYFEIGYFGYSGQYDTTLFVIEISHGKHSRLTAFHLVNFELSGFELHITKEQILRNDSLFEYGISVNNNLELKSITVFRFDSCRSGFTEREFCYLKSKNKYLLDRIEISSYNRKYEMKNSFNQYPSDYIYLGDSIPEAGPDLYFRNENKLTLENYKRDKRVKWGYAGFIIFNPQDYIHGKAKPDPYFQCDWDLLFIVRKMQEASVLKKSTGIISKSPN